MLPLSCEVVEIWFVGGGIAQVSDIGLHFQIALTSENVVSFS